MSATSSPMTENSQIGKYGTLSLIKRNGPETVITAFGIDSENLTFGREQDCGVRLYYPDVSPIHCKITFRERKAFLVVLGTHGLLVDGCKVYPSPSSASPTTIPLTNNSEIEIHEKRFRFTYPPKELRAQLYSTPTLPRTRGLRLSMIQSAEVFSPRPSNNPAENLRVLQSPLKPLKIRSGQSSPLKKSTAAPVRSLFSSTFTPQTSATQQEDEDDDEIILVEGDSPHVVEEDQDLVILEDVEIPLDLPPPTLGSRKSPTKSTYITAPPPILLQPLPPVTPRRPPRNSLHRAVLIRSAQRAVLKAELEREEQEEDLEEEMEVFGTVLAEEEEEEEEVDDNDDDDFETQELPLKDDESTGENEEEQESEQQKATWRKSLGSIWPFRRSTSPTKAKDEEVDVPLDVNDPMSIEAEQPAEGDENGVFSMLQEFKEEEEEAEENPGPLRVAPETPNNRRFAPPSGSAPTRGLFMTPQPQRLVPSQARSGAGPDRQRFSLGGGEARRIKIEEQPWRVQDLVVPPPPSSPVRASSDVADRGRPRTPGARLTEAEKRAIQERRRSALRMPETFFGGSGGIPGMGPSSPVKRADHQSSSPMKAGRLSTANFEEVDQLDTRSLLEMMKDTVEELKADRRASMSMDSPRKKKTVEGSVDKISEENEEFSLLRAPHKQLPRRSLFAEAAMSLETTDEPASDSSKPASTNEQDMDMADAPERSEESNAGNAPLPPPSEEIPISPLKTRTARKKAKVASKTLQTETPSLADDEGSPDVVGRRDDKDESSGDEKHTVKKGKLLRGTGKAVPDKDETKGMGSGSALKPPSKTRARSTKQFSEVQVVVEAATESSQVETLPVANDDTSLKPEAKTSRKKPVRGRSKTPVPPQSDSEDSGVPTTADEEPNQSRSVKTATGRRGTRKASADPEPRTATTSSEATPAPKTRGRKAPTPTPRTRGRSASVSDRPDSDAVPVSKNPPSRTRGKTPATTETEEENESTAIESSEEAAVTTVKRGRRPKAAVVPEPIKEEETEPLPAPKKSAPRTRKGVSAAENIPATTGTRSRATKKAAPAVPESPGEAGVDKENASEDEPVVTKTKVGRPRKNAVKVKEEPATEPELGTGTRTRAMRTRSKT